MNYTELDQVSDAEIAEISIEQRIEILANLIYDRIIDDRAEGEVLFRKIMEGGNDVA